MSVEPMVSVKRARTSFGTELMVVGDAIVKYEMKGAGAKRYHERLSGGGGNERQQRSGLLVEETWRHKAGVRASSRRRWQLYTRKVSVMRGGSALTPLRRESRGDGLRMTAMD